MLLKNRLEKQGIWLFRFRGVLPLVVLGLGFFEYLQTELHPEHFPLEEAPNEVFYEIGCLAISFVGLFVRIFTVGHTPARTSGRNVKEQVADRLNTTGIYSIVRNPLYLGNFLMWTGVALLTMNLWFILAFVFFYWLYYERIIFAEEQFLAGKFGSDYESWAEKTPCILPRFSQYKAPALAFSWKKVVKKEKNGLLALLIVFSLFDIVGEWLVGEPPKYIPLAIFTGVVLVAYLLLKYLKRHTSLLDEAGR